MALISASSCAGRGVVWACLLAFSLAIRVPLPYISDRFPQAQAERFIKALNLLPGAGQNGEDNANESGLVEHRIHVDVEGDSGSSKGSDELGQHAGYFKLKNTHASRMFYLFFESRGNKTNDPLVLWMSGGPGCSSELAVFNENGPFQITDNLTLVWNDYGWDKASSIIFVDQPIGTGFSYSTDLRDLRYDESGISSDMYNFLQAFFEAHPEFIRNEFYVTGESYAGHYVPAVTSRIHQGNKAREGISINLKGFAIGNGLTHPEIQYRAYGEYALDMGLITDDDYKRISKLYPACSLSIKLCGSRGTISCIASYLVCNSIFNSILKIAGNVNYYDIRKECRGSLCYDFSNMESYLNDPSVKEALGVGNRKFVSCNPLVYEVMLIDWMRNLEVGIPELLEDGIKLLVYAGEYDLICNWLGNSRWVSAIEWSGKDKYALALSKPFMVDGEEAGIISSFGPLNFLKVHNSGHMVPMDQPKAALEMIKRFTRENALDNSFLDMLETSTEGHQLAS
eukprot:c26745_g1_i1 orf=515-2047(-)